MYNANNDDDNDTHTKNAEKYLVNGNLKRLEWASWQEEEFIKINKKINKKENKFFVVGYFDGEIIDTNIFIDTFNAGYLPRGGGNMLLCIFIYYLRHIYKKYSTTEIFNIELKNTTFENSKAYQKMGFEHSDNYYFSGHSPTMKLNNEKFNSQCKNINIENENIVFYTDV